MQKITKFGSAILFGSMVFLLFLVVFERILHIPGWLAVAGRMHPMFLHFPIVLLLLSFFTVWIPKGKDHTDQWLNLLRLIAALSAAITAIMGMLLSLEDGRSGDLLQQHKWGGVLVAIFGFLFYSYFPLLSKRVIFTRSFTVIATLVIIVTGHWGADLTHGEDYVLAPIKKNEIRTVPPEQAIIFADVIQPILEKKCVSCHGEASIKGELLLSDLKGVLAGGKSGLAGYGPRRSALASKADEQERQHCATKSCGGVFCRNDGEEAWRRNDAARHPISRRVHGGL